MSRLSKYLRSHYAKHDEPADAIIRRWLGKWTNEIMDVAETAVRLIDLADMGGEWKREVVKEIIMAALSKYGIHLPDRALNYIIERILAVLDDVLNAPDPAPPVPPIDNTDPEPTPYPPAPDPPTIPEPPAPTIPPVPDPVPPPALYEVLYHTEPEYRLYAHGDKVYVDNREHPTLWYVVPGYYMTPVLLPTVLDPTVWRVL